MSEYGDAGEGERDARWMRRCRELAREAASAGEAAVGCVVTTGEGTLIAEGVENVRGTLDVTAHAEVEAVRAACRALGTSDLSGCVLYTTTEPCLLCSYAIRETRIARVVIGSWVEEIGGVTSPYPLLVTQFTGNWPPPPVVVRVDP
jgi:tRNA(adenine34) deaminase